MAWEEMCFPIEEGGLGYRLLFDMNRALIVKLWWNFRTSIGSLWCTFMANKYCKKMHPSLSTPEGHLRFGKA